MDSVDERLAGIFVSRGLIGAADVERWRRDSSGARLVDFLLAQGLLTPDRLNSSMTMVAAETAVESTDARGGEPIGRFRRLGLLGRGGFGEVLRAWDPLLGREVALKLVQEAAPAEIDRLRREARMAARLRHPNAVALHEIGEHEGRPFLVMDYIDGAPLSKQALPTRRLLEAVRDAARAVHAAHALGIVHRDIKPDNLLMDASGRVYVADFGLARGVQAHREGEIVGTPRYMSPEQARGGRVDERSDVYGLGAVLYWGVTGRAPAEGQTVADTLRAVIEQSPPTPNADRDLTTIVMTALAREPERRYPTAEALAGDLERYLAGDPITARPASLIDRWVKRVRKHPAAFTAGAVALAAVVTVVSMVTIRYAQSRDELAAARAAADPETALAHYERSMKLWNSPEARVGAEAARSLLALRRAELEARQRRQRLAQLYATAAADLTDVWPRIELAGLIGRPPESADDLIRRVDASVPPEGRVLAVWASLMVGRASESDLDREVERASDDPMAPLLRARWNLIVSIRLLGVPGGHMSSRGFELVDSPWPESSELTRRMERAERDLARAESISTGGDPSSALRLKSAAVAVKLMIEARRTGGAPTEFRRAAQAIGADTAWPEFAYLHGLAWYLAGDFESAGRAWDAAAARLGDWAELHFWMGLASWFEGLRRSRDGGDAGFSLRAAARCFERALATNPNMIAVHLNLGTALAVLGQWESRGGGDPRDTLRASLRSLDRAVAAKVPDALWSRAQIRMILGRQEGLRGRDPLEHYRAAVEDYTAALDGGGDRAELLAGRGAARAQTVEALVWRLQEFDAEARAAQKDLDEAVALGASGADALIARARLLHTLGQVERSREKLRRAVEDLDRALKMQDDAATHVSRGLALGDLAELEDDPEAILEQAVDEYGLAIALAPQMPEAHHNRGKARIALGELMLADRSKAHPMFRAAIRDLDRALEINPALVATYTMRGNAYARLGSEDDFASAIRDFSEALSRDPTYAPALVGRGNAHLEMLFALARRGEPNSDHAERAAADYQSALTLSPRDWTAHAGFGHYFRALSRWEEAREALETALEINPNAPGLRELLEDTKRRAGDF